MNDTAWIGPRDPINCQLNTVLGEAAQADAMERELLERIKKCLHRWASRYAESAHAKAHVKETKLLEQEIDEWLLKQ